MNTNKQDQNNKPDSLSFLAETAIQFASSGINHKIYNFIGQCMMKLNPEAIIVVNSIDLENGFLRIEEFMTPGQKLDKIVSLLGFNPVGKIIKVDDSLLELTTGAIQKFQHGIHELSFKSIPSPVSKVIEKVLNLGDIYGIGFMIDNRIFANASIMLQKGKELANTEIIETFVRQASVTLKRIEAEKNEEKFRSLFEFMTDGAFYQRPNGQITDVNTAALKLFGLSHEELLSKDPKNPEWNIINENFQHISIEDLSGRIAIKTGQAVYNHTVGVYNPKKRDYVWVITNAIPQFMPGEKTPYRVFVTMHDISEQRQKDEALRKSEEKFAKAFQNSPDIIIITSVSDGKIIEVNDNIFRTAQFQKVEVIGKTTIDLNLWEDIKKRNEFVEKLQTQGSVLNFETNFRKKSGELFTGLISGEFIELQGQKSVLSVIHDISDIRLAEKLRIESQANARAIMESTNDILILLDKNGLIIDTNEAHAKRLGLSRNELLGKNVFELLPDVVAQKRLDFFNQVLETGKPAHFEDFRQGYWSDISFYPIFDENFKTEKVAIFSKDITERKRLDEALLVSEKRFHLLFENSLDAIVLSHPDGRILSANPAACMMFGQSEEQMCESGRNSIMDSTDPRLKSALEERAKTGKFYGELTGLRNDGSKFPVELTSQLFNDSYGNVQASIIFRDITGRKKDEHALKESEARLSAFMQFIPALILIKDHELRPIYANNKLKQLFPFDDWKGKKPDELFPPEVADLMIKQDTHAFNQGYTSYEENWTDSRGINHVFSTEKFKIDIPDHEPLLGAIISDITGRKQAELEIQKVNNDLKESNATKDKFFSIIAHDLKSPFNSIVGFSELLVEQIKEKDYDGIEKYAGIILGSSQRAMDLLMNLMEWSQSQTGRIEFNPEFIEMVEVINETELLFDEITRQKSMVIKNAVARHVPVFADKAMINTVLRNLISNAIKFTKPGGEIVISITEKPDNITVSVKDSGVGISADRIDKLFRIDESYSTPGTNNERGTGLGLILCKEFIEKHGGKIWVKSEEGKGSTFFFTLNPSINLVNQNI